MLFATRRLVLLLALVGPMALAPIALAGEQSSDPPGGKQGEGPPKLSAVSLAEATTATLSIDGRLDEGAWASAPVASGFTQREPVPGDPATERTEVRVLYDANAIYVGFRCYLRDPSTLISRMARRDDFIQSDLALVAFDSYDDGRTAFVFAVTPAGSPRDFLIYNDVEEDTSWDAVWDVATSVEETGWTAEFRIPLSQLRFRADEGAQDWGIQFGREIVHNGESDFWAPFPPEASGTVSSFGRLLDLRGLRAPRRLEVTPYVASKLERVPGDAADPFYSENDLGANVGADLRYGLTSDLTLTATLNPDFGQVEADPAVVNLSQFENFFEERRPFFVEGVDIFQFGNTRTFNVDFRPTFFYSRRIGRSPRRNLSDDFGDADFVDSPNETTIAGAAKLSGKVGDWSVGVLEAVTTREYGQHVVGDGPIERAIVEPWANYAVGRVKRDFRGGQTVVGGLVTAANRRLADDPVFEDLMPSSAYVGGLDFEHQFGDQTYAVSGVGAFSRVNGSTSVITDLQRAPQRYYQRPDDASASVDSSATSLSGYYGQLSIAKIRGEHVTGSLTYTDIAPGFDVNDLGFQFRAGVRALSYATSYQDNNPASDLLNRWRVNFFGGGGWNRDGNRINGYMGTFSNVQFSSRWGFFGNAIYIPPGTNDRLTRGGPRSTYPAGLRTLLGSFSDFRKPFAVEGGFNQRFDTSGEYDRYAFSTFVWRPNTTVSVEVNPELGWEKDTDQYVGTEDAAAMTATGGTRYLFADVTSQNVSLGMRLNWTFSPTLTLQLFARPFIAAYRYENYKQFAEPGTYTFDVFGDDTGTITRGQVEDGTFVPDAEGDTFEVNPGDGGETFRIDRQDFTFRSLRGNAVLRWEYRPASAIFLVWQQQRAGSIGSDQLDAGTFNFGRDLGDAFRDEVENVFLLKATYWIGS
ncbi:MAG: DUF5916 domain-containing protein [Bacteroidota bacterium]